MTDEYETLIGELDIAFFRYAHLTGAVEFYMLVLGKKELQLAVSKVLSGDETEWKQIHRFMVIDGKQVTWYPEMSVQSILDEMSHLLGYLLGVTLSRMIGSLDYYLGSVLENHYFHTELSGSSWERFIEKTKIALLKRKHGEFVYTLLQERHKIEHNRAQIDRKFVERLATRGIQHAYRDGDAIEKSHLDVLFSHQAIREFAKDVDEAIQNVVDSEERGIGSV